jgi:chemosensory pili system protein ChpA (sensor histidine kinase/response regulator)
LLSEGTLLLLNLKSDQQAAPVAPAAGEPELTVAQWARRLRTRFQLGLVGWIRGERPEQKLEILETVAHQLEQVATRQPCSSCGGWWAPLSKRCGKAASRPASPSSASWASPIARSCSCTRKGEGRYAQNPPVELLNNLLYYAAPRDQQWSQGHGGARLVPAQRAAQRRRFGRAGTRKPFRTVVKLMRTVSAAIREDLGKVKDVLDIYVRRGGQPAELEAQVGMLRKIGDTLGVLGLGELRQLVLEETSRLEAMAAGKTPADHAALVHIAATLINVEDRLDRDLVGLIVPKAPAKRRARMAHPPTPTSSRSRRPCCASAA